MGNKALESYRQFGLMSSSSSSGKAEQRSLWNFLSNPTVAKQSTASKGKTLKKRSREDDAMLEESRCPICNRLLWRDQSLTNLHVDSCLDKQQVKANASHSVHSLPALTREYDIRALPAPLGVWVIMDFVSEEEEIQIVQQLDGDQSTPWKHSSFNGHCLSKVYGVRTQFGLPNEPRLVRENDETQGEFGLPSFLQSYPLRLQSIAAQRKDMPIDVRTFAPNECNANQYQKSLKHYLKPHYDDRALSGPILMNLSLLGRSRMTYTKPGSTESIVVDLPPRCLQLVTGPARWDYMHAIKLEDVLDERRVSITWRYSGAKRSGIQPLATLGKSIFSMSKQEKEDAVDNNLRNTSEPEIFVID